MNRLFGFNSSSKAPPVTLEDATNKLDTRVNTLNNKILALDNELGQIQKQLSVARPGTSTRESLRSQARTLLSQKRLLQMQREKLNSQSLNLFQMDLATSSLTDANDTIQAMKVAKKQLQAGIKKTNPDMAEILGEEIGELCADAWEVQELLGRSYDVGSTAVDEDGLEEELRILEGGDYGPIELGHDDFLERVNSESIKIDLPELPTSLFVNENVKLENK